MGKAKVLAWISTIFAIIPILSIALGCALFIFTPFAILLGLIGYGLMLLFLQLLWLSPIGLILGIISLVLSKKEIKTSKKVIYTGIILNSILILVFIFFILNPPNLEAM